MYCMYICVYMERRMLSFITHIHLYSNLLISLFINRLFIFVFRFLGVVAQWYSADVSKTRKTRKSKLFYILTKELKIEK
jgi:hypothetical protein